MRKTKSGSFYIIAAACFFLWMLFGPYFFILPLLVLGAKKSGLTIGDYEASSLFADHIYIPMIIAYVLGIVVFLCLFFDEIKTAFPYKRKDIIMDVIIVPVGLSLMFGAGYFTEWFYSLFQLSPTGAENQQAIIASLNGKMAVFVKIFVLLIAPIFEEILFRKLCYSALKKNTRLPAWVVVVLVALIFALVHVFDAADLKYLLAYFIPALILTSCYALGKENLYVSASLHILNNLLALILNI